MISTPLPESTHESAVFQTLEDLRHEHTGLLRSYHSAGTTPDFLRAAEAFILHGRKLGILLDRTEERVEAQRILDQWATVLCKAGRSEKQKEIESTLFEYEGRDLSGQPSPYVGLNPFGEGDHSLFFGRGRLREQAITILSRERLLAVFGLSGSGKSSLVRGGIIPDLRAGVLPQSDSWLYVSLVPGAEPLQSLLTTLRDVAPSTGTVAPNAAAVIAHPSLLVDVMRQAQPGRSLFVLVDQFEEVFTLCEDPRAREAFVDALLAFVDQPDAAHRVILTMRSDFEPRLTSLERLQRHLAEGQNILRVTPLTREELREAIEQPAKAVGLHFHREVVDALVRDVADEIAALPLLQFTLRILWETRDRDRVTMQQYLRLGGAKGALAHRADEVFKGFIEENQTIARCILLRMVRIGEALEVTSGRVRRSSLYEMGFPRERVELVIQKLVESGLVRVTCRGKTEDDHLEVAHEAMVRNWKRLLSWLEEDRVKLIMRRRLDDKAAEWARLGSGHAALLDEVPLKEAEQWLQMPDARAFGYHPKLPALVAESRQTIDSARRAKQRAQVEKVRVMWGGIIILVALLIAAVWGWVSARNREQDANRQRQLAEQQTRWAKTQKIVADEKARIAAGAVAEIFLAAAKRHAKPETSLAYAWQAMRTLQSNSVPVSQEASNTLLFAAAAARYRWMTNTVFVSGLSRLSFNSNGARVVGADQQGITIWDATTGNKITNFATSSGGAGRTFTTFGDSYASRFAELYQPKNEVVVWDLELAGKPAVLTNVSAKPKQPLAGARFPVSQAPRNDGLMALGSRGQYLIISDGKIAQIWEIAATRIIATNRFSESGATNVYKLALNGNEDRYAAVGENGTVAIYDVRSGGEIAKLPGQTHSVLSLAFSPDGSMLAFGASDGNVNVWNIGQEKPRQMKNPGTRPMTNVALVSFSMDGRRLAGLGSDGVARIWDPETGTDLFTGPPLDLREYRLRTLAAAFSPNLEALVMAFGDVWGPTVTLYVLKDIADPLRDVGQISNKLTIDDYQNVLGDFAPSLRTGVGQARKGEIDNAIKSFEDALKLPGVEFDARAEAKRIGAESQIEEGRLLAGKGDLKRASDAFRKALELNPALAIDPENEAKRARAQVLVSEGRFFAQRGQFTNGLAAYWEALTLWPDLKIRADEWNSLAWEGCLHGFATNPLYASNILYAAEQAVSLRPESGGIKDTRGLARALTGNTNGAIEDFEFYINSGDARGERLNMRRKWVEQLRLGNNPFTPEEFRRLRSLNNPIISLESELEF